MPSPGVGCINGPVRHRRPRGDIYVFVSSESCAIFQPDMLPRRYHGDNRGFLGDLGPPHFMAVVRLHIISVHLLPPDCPRFPRNRSYLSPYNISRRTILIYVSTFFQKKPTEFHLPSSLRSAPVSRYIFLSPFLTCTIPNLTIKPLVQQCKR